MAVSAAEISQGNLRLVELALRERHALVRSAEMAGCVERDERSVHGVTRPAVRAGLESIADFLATLARACF